MTVEILLSWPANLIEAGVMRYNGAMEEIDMDQTLFDRLYQAVAACDAAYDGVYYTGVRSTGIVCRPSCRARTPKPENVTFYRTLEEALQAGYRPCKRCRPDEHGALRPDAVLAMQADAMLAAGEGRPPKLAELAAELGVSPWHLHRIYKEVTGQTPAARSDALRLEKACGLLAEGKRPIAEAGRCAGFRSASHFAAWFQQRTGMTPSEYRLSLREGAAGEAAGEDIAEEENR